VLDDVRLSSPAALSVVDACGTDIDGSTPATIQLGVDPLELPSR
jgi:hypothetical protein